MCTLQLGFGSPIITKVCNRGNILLHHETITPTFKNSPRFIEYRGVQLYSFFHNIFDTKDKMMMMIHSEKGKRQFVEKLN
jgi:hypothetical protein